MKVKIDTKEKLHVITPEHNTISANMTEGLSEMLLAYTQMKIKNVVLNLALVKNIDKTVAESIYQLQQSFYERKVSFVICGMKKQVKLIFEEMDLLDVLNYTPTESEAWDIVQMEEIEREFLH